MNSSQASPLDQLKSLPADQQLQVAEVGLFALKHFQGASRPATNDQHEEVVALRQRIRELERQVAGYHELSSELACANRQVAVLEEYKQLHLKYMNQRASMGSAERGKQLESLTEDVLNGLFPDAVITRTTGVAHSGDFLLQFGKTLVMVECKNYTAAVNQAEVDKFESDAKTTRAQVALIVSLQSSIRGKRKVDVRRVDDCLLGYVVCASEADLLGLGLMVRSMLATQCVFASSQEQDVFIGRAQQALGSAQALAKDIDRYLVYNQKHLKDVKEAAALVQSATRGMEQTLTAASRLEGL